MRMYREGSPRLSLAAMVLFLVPVGGIDLALADTPSVSVTTTDTPRKKDEALSEVVVTGSRIARPETERLQPTTVITADTLDKRGITNVVDALSELPEFGQPDNSLAGLQSGFGVGQSFANFFSLGSQRTLTLVDGRRFVPGNSPSIFGATGNGGEQVDLNSIPTQLIDRVEAVAVGGAPIYGSDAIAGTVNIILKHNYEGLDVAADGGTSTHGDANLGRVRALAGKNFDDGKGNVELNVEYADLRGLSDTQRTRYSSDIAYLQPPTPSPYAYQVYNKFRIGSISTMGVPMVGDGYLNFNPNFAILNAAGQTVAFNNAGHLAPYTLGPADGSGVNNIGGDGLDFSQLRTLESPQKRFNVTALSHFDVNDNVRVFGELWYSGTHTAYPISQGAYDTALFAPAGQVSGNLLLNAN